MIMSMSMPDHEGTEDSSAHPCANDEEVCEYESGEISCASIASGGCPPVVSTKKNPQEGDRAAGRLGDVVPNLAEENRLNGVDAFGALTQLATSLKSPDAAAVKRKRNAGKRESGEKVRLYTCICYLSMFQAIKSHITLFVHYKFDVSGGAGGKLRGAGLSIVDEEAELLSEQQKGEFERLF